MRAWTALILASLITAGLAARHLFAYEAHPTHKKLAENTVALAVNDDQPSYEELSHYSDLIVLNDVDEDKVPRFLRHFYDPTTGLGLPTVSYTLLIAAATDLDTPPNSSATSYTTALDWARNGTPDHLDWEGAIQAYDYDLNSRQKAYSALGHALHLVEDMGQPDHAFDWPHPGNALNSSQQAITLNGKVGYETLWALVNTWPKGNKVRKRDHFEDYFNEMAALGQKKAKELGLPLPDELALGLGKFSSTLPVGLLKGAAGFAQNGWSFYELKIPLSPTIPFPEKQDFRTEAYIRLGQELLPVTEEYGAGLLEFFHDIVSPPPYVQQVRILQDGVLKYEKTYSNVSSAFSGKLIRRDPELQKNDPLSTDKDAEVEISFGAAPPEGAAGSQVQLGGIRVAVEAIDASSSNSSVCAVDAKTVKGPPDLGGGLVWKGTFRPQAGGVLCIEAQDANNHFEGRKQPGHVLDDTPGTPARAGRKAPYDWTGYDSGPDRNHRFHVAGEPPGCPGDPDDAAILRARWATWHGESKAETHSRAFQLMFGDHGDFWNQIDGGETSIFRLRSTDTASLRLASKYDGTIPYALNFSLPHEVTRNASYSIRKEHLDGFVEEFTSTTPMEATPEYKLEGNQCDDGNYRGGVSGGSVGATYHGKQDFQKGSSSWSVAWEGSAEPAHVRLIKSLKLPDSPDELDDFLHDPLAAYKNQLARSMDVQLRHFSNSRLSEVDYQRLAAMVRNIPDAHQSGQIQISQAANDIYAFYGQLGASWLTWSDENYSQTLEKLQDAVTKWKNFKKILEAEYAEDTDQMAEIETKSGEYIFPKLLKDMSSKLANEGAEAFR